MIVKCIFATKLRDTDSNSSACSTVSPRAKIQGNYIIMMDKIYNNWYNAMNYYFTATSIEYCLSSLLWFQSSFILKIVYYFVQTGEQALKHTFNILI